MARSVIESSIHDEVMITTSTHHEVMNTTTTHHRSMATTDMRRESMNGMAISFGAGKSWIWASASNMVCTRPASLRYEVGQSIDWTANMRITTALGRIFVSISKQTHIFLV
jgi:hypothetical protein